MNLNEPTILPQQKNDNKHKYTLNKHTHCTTCTTYTTNNHKIKKNKCRDDKNCKLKQQNSNFISIIGTSKLWPLNLIYHQNFILQTSKTIHATPMHVLNLESFQAT
jgi:hypothetical protein